MLRPGHTNESPTPLLSAVGVNCDDRLLRRVNPAIIETSVSRVHQRHQRGSGDRLRPNSGLSTALGNHQVSVAVVSVTTSAW